MKYLTVALAAVVGLSVVSCNENEQPKPSARHSFADLQQGTVTYSPNIVSQPGTMQPAMNSAAQPMSNQAQPMTRADLNLSGLTVQPTAPAEKLPVEPPIQIPANARYTLYCSSMVGPDRFARIGELKSALSTKTGLKDWYVIHDQNGSTLFYGFYSAVEKSDPASGRAHADQRAIRQLKNDVGDLLFPTCFFTPIVQPDPVAPAEWKLTNAPAKNYWSLEVAAFRDNPLRKQAAVDMVKEFRSKGVEAYFYHGESISSVCVGAWPKEAIEQQEDDKGRTVSPEDDVLVTPDPLPERYQKAQMMSKDGHRIRPFTQRIEVADPSLKATMAEYPNHLVNYELMAHVAKMPDGTKKKLDAPSFLVVIPREQPSGLDNAPPVLNQANSLPPPTDSTRQPGTARLRGLGN